MKKTIALIAVVLLVGALVGTYWLFQPHRNVTNSTVDHHLKVEVLVNEYLKDAKAANAKYLAADGVSNIIALRGTVNKIRQSSDGRTIIVLKQKGSKAGFQCLFVAEADTAGLHLQNTVIIKGVLRAGPGYDDDLEMYENGYLEECTLVELILVDQ